MRNTRHASLGFTLIEVLIYVAISGMLVLSVSTFFAMTIETRNKNQSITEVNQQGQAVMDYITYTIRNADSITAPATGTTGSTLTLVVPTASLSPTTFNLNGATLQVKEGAGAAVALTSDKVQITSLNFRNLSRATTPGVVRVSFVVSRVNHSGRTEYNYQKTFTTSVALR